MRKSLPLAPDAKPDKPITGKTVFWIMFAFFAVIIVVNLIMVTLAVKTFRGEDETKSYLQGLNYNDTLQQRREQDQLGWRADLKINDHAIILTIVDADHDPVEALTVTGLLKHPAETDLDVKLSFDQDGDGRYVASFPADVHGLRHLYTYARSDDGKTFNTRNDDLWLK